MTALPTAADLTGATLTEGQFKTALSNLRGYLSGLMGDTGVPADALAALMTPFATIAAKTAAYTVAITDRGRVIACSGSWTLGLPAAATAGAGFNTTVINTGTGAITLDPSGAETVDGAATLVLAPGQAVALICTGTAWLTLGRPGPGIGLTTQVPLVADMADPAIPVGVWRFDATTLNNATGATAGILLLLRYNSATLAQIVITGTLYLVRYYASGAWGAWRRQYSTANILAPVGLSSGVPTGGILERGSNANGEYVRFADGTQICQQSAATFSYADADHLAFTWTYPAAFVTGSVPIRQVAVSNSNADLTGISIQQIGGLRLGAGVISAAHRLYRAQGAASFASGNQIANCGLMAIGRWA